jgi:YHS domain-containing protein
MRSASPLKPAEPAHDLHTPQTARLLVRDPVCGVHLAEVLAIPLRENGEVLHFCSPACRDTYLGSSRKLAANA